MTARAKKTLNWVFGKSPDVKVYEVAIEPGHCPFCLANETVVELPPPLLEKQPDDTTHVCLPAIGGCNQGFAMTAKSPLDAAMATQPTDNEHHERNRRRNVLKIAGVIDSVLREHGTGVCSEAAAKFVAGLSDQNWKSAYTEAHVEEPSAGTRAVVVAFYAARTEQAREDRAAERDDDGYAAMVEQAGA